MVTCLFSCRNVFQRNIEIAYTSTCPSRRMTPNLTYADENQLAIVNKYKFIFLQNVNFFVWPTGMKTNLSDSKVHSSRTSGRVLKIYTDGRRTTCCPIHESPKRWVWNFFCLFGTHLDWIFSTAVSKQCCARGVAIRGLEKE